MMDNDKAIRAAKLTLGGLLEKKRAKTAVERAQGQIAPSKYLPDVPRQVHADGGAVSKNLAKFIEGNHPEVPHVLYHATQRDFSTFKKGRSVQANFNNAQKTLGHFFTDDPEYANQYVSGWDGYKENASVMPVHLSMKNPKIEDISKINEIENEWSVRQGAMYRKQLEDMGHDGIIFKGTAKIGPIKEFVAFHPHQIKSAIGNSGDFDPESSDITKADGGEVAPDAPPPVDLGQVREQKQLQTFHTGMMGDINTRMTQAMEAHQKALDAGHFDGYEVGDVLQGKKTPMRIIGRYVQPWKPTRMTLDHFDHMGAKPTIIEHEGKQYIPMLRYQTGKEGEEGFQEGAAYLDGVKAAGYQKMGGLRVVKARGGAVGPEFEKWFAGSKVKHPDGRPMLMVHASPNSDIKAFRRNNRGGIWFSPAHDTSEADIVASDTGRGTLPNPNPDQHPDVGVGAAYYPVHLAIKNPARGELADDFYSGGETVQSLKRKGYDGVAYDDDVHVAFDPHQIKSPFNQGTFNPKDPDILKARGGAVEFMQGNHPDVPEVLYHGTKADFRSFNPMSHFGTLKAAEERLNPANEPWQNEYGHEGKSVIPVHVSMKNPLDVGVEDNPGGNIGWHSPSDMVWQAAQTLRRNGKKSHADRIDSMMDGLIDAENDNEDLTPHLKKVSDVLRDAGHDGLMYTNQVEDAGSKSFVPLDPGQVKSALSARKFDPANPDMTYADGGAAGGYVPQKTVKAYKLFRTKGDGNLYPLFVHADKPVEMGKWLEAEEGPQGKEQGKVKSKLGDLAYRPGWHAGDLPIATHIGGKSSPDLKKPDYRPDNHVWAEVEMAADKDWQSEADSRGRGVKAHITDQVPLKGFYRYKTNPNMTGNWLIGGHMKVNRVLSDDEVKEINDRAGTADLPRLERTAKADGGSITERSPMFEGMSEHLLDEGGKPVELWHGTPGQPFEAFDDAKLGVRDAGFFGRGHYLTPDRGVADAYADPDEMGRGSVMGPLHAALKNPYVWDVSDEQKSHSTLRDLQSMGIMKGQGKMEPWDNLQRHHIDPFMEEMQRRGHDGVIYKTNQGVKEIVVFNPTAIKHRDAEVGDPNDPRIMRATGGKVDLYSKAARVLSGLKDRPMQVEDIIKYALGKGVKRSEIDYTDPPRGGMARPSQVAQHIADMQPQIGVQRREAPGEGFRFGSSREYEREVNRLQDRRQFDAAENLIAEWEQFSGFGGDGDPRYAQYQLPGGQNYREHILTLDNHQGQTYTAPMHWGGTKNPLAHIRMSDRMIGNKKILHIEELQSDWNNDARKKGFSTGTEKQDYENYVTELRRHMIGQIDQNASPMIRDALRDKYNVMDPYMLALKAGRQSEHNRLAAAAFDASKRPPKAPYINPDRDDASELAMKHVLTEAAKGGYDGIAFTPDAAQSERWNGANFNGIYDKKLPSMAQRLVRQHDIQGGSADNPQSIGGYNAPHVELTDKARQGILQNGFSSFQRGGYVTHVRRMR